MTERPEDICPRPRPIQPSGEPHAPALHPASVYRCDSPEHAQGLLAGELPGYVYQRDGHPNADMLADQLRRLHTATHAAVVPSGMAALGAILLSQLQQGDHVVASSRLYGGSGRLLSQEASRLGIAASVVDTCDLDATAAAVTSATRLLIAETITNPLLRVSDVAALAEIAHRRGARLVIDNTLASPGICRPLELGADVVVESLTKIINGHSDVVLGGLCGNEEAWERMPEVLSTWGWCSSPWDCWLALRGMETLAVRLEKACDNAQRTAELLAGDSRVTGVHYPGLPDHPDHTLARRQFGDRFGTMIAFTLSGGWDAAAGFIKTAHHIPFCPSLGELSTTLSHPASTSHRGLSEDQRTELGIEDGTLRLSLGIESFDLIRDAIVEGLQGVPRG